ncbi:MAG TPA: UDP-N-acetylmuramoyl-L-alanine--D-glutamate ligase [Candidatus Dormibacteraeota bacterium]|nr:UDP-N-acetylmuramoyl-L-alanine--D-glutamate ligase [Candidatus Dormibacteraeota bacterium]
MSRRAIVVGLGISGAACARVLSAEGWRVLVVDRGDGEAQRRTAATLPPEVEVALGGYDDDVATGADMVCPSPGVPWDAPVLENARRHGVAVRSEIDLVFERCPAPIAGVTGTNGKTTTTALLGAVLGAAGARVHVGGNIGETMLDRLGDVRPDDWVVLELSSFQLESAADPRCRLATVLNLTPDHLDRHGTMERYGLAKRRLVEAADPDGAVALNGADPLTRAMAPASAAPVRLFSPDPGDLAGGDGATVVGGEVTSVEGGVAVAVMPVAEIPLLGAHNVSNVLAAVALGRAARIPAAALAEAVRGFHAVAHRLEPVLESDGVLWINDSKATNVDAAVTGLRSLGDRPVVWIGGGGSKGVGPEALAAEVAARARHAVVNGATGAELDAALAAAGCAARTRVATLAEAVAAARRVARPGDAVLLSPGYTSFDQFSGFEERGREFVRLVREICSTAGRC